MKFTDYQISHYKVSEWKVAGNGLSLGFSWLPFPFQHQTAKTVLVQSMIHAALEMDPAQFAPFLEHQESSLGACDSQILSPFWAVTAVVEQATPSYSEFIAKPQLRTLELKMLQLLLFAVSFFLSDTACMIGFTFQCTTTSNTTLYWQPKAVKVPDTFNLDEW